MAKWTDYLEDAFDTVTTYTEGAISDPIGTILTGGLKPAFKAAQKTYENYAMRNGGRQALQRASQMEAEAAALAKSDAEKKLAGETMLASMPYASAFGQPNPSLLSPQQPKKTILGSF